MAAISRTKGSTPLRIAALVKQIPTVEDLELGPDGRLRRDGAELHMNDYCRRAVSKGVELARRTGGSCVAITLGPPSADTVCREAILWGADRGVHITDPAFAGSDTLATARALAAAVQLLGPFDLILLGRNSVDADTGQVPPELAELLGLPFVTGVRELEIAGMTMRVRLEHDDERVDATVELPAVASCAERLCDPCKIKDPAQWATVDDGRIRRLTAADLGPGPWGHEASPTTVGAIRVIEAERASEVLSGPLGSQVERVVDVLVERGALAGGDHDVQAPAAAPGVTRTGSPTVAVLFEPGRERITRELVGEAARLAGQIDGRTVVLGTALPRASVLASWGADGAVSIAGSVVEEDVAHAVARWADDVGPWAILAPGSAWGREVAARAAARLGAGLTGDAVSFHVDRDRLVAHKPAFGGRLVADITCRSPIQMATVRAGVLPLALPRDGTAVTVTSIAAPSRSRVAVSRRSREDNVEELAAAPVVVGIGQGVSPEHYAELETHCRRIGAELCATRKVTDAGWMPRARQVGITGRSIAPRLYIAIGLSGKFNHTVGVRAAGTIVAVNPDPDAPIFEWADVGLVADWREVFALLIPALEDAMTSITEERWSARRGTGGPCPAPALGASPGGAR
jgi:electron transfer flavoprotein alpha subunit